MKNVLNIFFSPNSFFWSKKGIELILKLYLRLLSIQNLRKIIFIIDDDQKTFEMKFLNAQAL